MGASFDDLPVILQADIASRAVRELKSVIAREPEVVERATFCCQLGLRPLFLPTTDCDASRLLLAGCHLFAKYKLLLGESEDPYEIYRPHIGLPRLWADALYARHWGLRVLSGFNDQLNQMREQENKEMEKRENMMKNSRSRRVLATKYDRARASKRALVTDTKILLDAGRLSNNSEKLAQRRAFETYDFLG